MAHFENNPKPKQRLLYLVSEDWYFCSHRLKLAATAKEKGYEVAVATRVNAHSKVIQQHGLTLFPLKHFRRAGLNPWREILTLIEIWRLYRQFKPDIVHHVAIKPVLYGSLVARLYKIPQVVNALAGMGYLFTSKKTIPRLASTLLLKVFRKIFNQKHHTLIVQNQDDERLWRDYAKVKPTRIALIRGSGVDIKQFSPSPEPEGIPIVVCASRMLKDKGIEDLAQAALILARKRIRARILLCGPADDDNPGSLSATQLRQWEQNVSLEWLGPVADMSKRYAECHIAVLPSYREGMPKSLLEAAAAGLPIITTNVPGCREVVENGRNGLLVPAQQPIALAEALGILINHSKLRQKFGRASRKKAVNEFADSLIIEQTLNLYAEKHIATTQEAIVDAA
ncbi:MAG: glycosyltransferase family 4 protein [Pseudomonadota bacterium]